MTQIKDYGILTLGSYLRKISDLLYREVDEIYSNQKLEMPARSVPCLILIKDSGQLPITVLAEKLGQSHSAISQMTKKLMEHDLVFDSIDPADERRRLVNLTPKGYEYLDKLEPIFHQIRRQLNVMLNEQGQDLIQLLSSFEDEQVNQPLHSRVIAELSKVKSNNIKIVDFNESYRDIFKALNVEWLEKYFYVEEVDEKVLSHPEEYIINPGGHIFIALVNEKPVGTVALICDSDDRLELSKMAVTEGYQGLGIGRKLLSQAIELFNKSDYSILFLESNSKLKAAIGMYESVGFIHRRKPGNETHYQRADVYMEYQPEIVTSES
ncbi:bifunctional helix-turn-helix transcriptional regulator/GNAT family N-acetyltransferase [Pleionea sediminis]|uniref:bifunctional helix-turn-helix transcriptional regulator/GNAT family N-acetyltransferase n=1 Tax=Pleionea sediminis TaxID=2569479 RepID=UPI0011850163|nr:bifunctional helix-turn-helix transcriptional regulator/GNAT family N-acetyltransferase [Pleionea sediminis]